MTMKNTTVAAPPCSNRHQPQEPDAPIFASKKDNHGHDDEQRRLDWYGAPLLQESFESQWLRLACHCQEFTGTTNSLCKNYLQCNLVVLPQAYAYDFLTFCQRNPKACPLIEVLEPGSPHPHALARNADLRSDLPKYCVYRHGKLVKEVLDITEYWHDDLVSFLIGCSFTFDGALEKAGMASPAQVSMYKTVLKCRSAGVFRGKVVVSMRPVHSAKVTLHSRITSQFPHAHGGPVCVGSPESIGIENLASPDWGPASTPLPPNHVPVFHACGVTPQNVVLQNDAIPLCLTHSPGHMFVTDVPAE